MNTALGDINYQDKMDIRDPCVLSETGIFSDLFAKRNLSFDSLKHLSTPSAKWDKVALIYKMGSSKVFMEDSH